jgi:hypothetical protein
MPLIHETTHNGIRSMTFHCPGCEEAHLIPIDGSHGWEWNGSFDKPTFSPSILVTWGNHPGHRQCHSFVRDGQWQFQADCTHALAGKTVPMVDLPT